MGKICPNFLLRYRSKVILILIQQPAYVNSSTLFEEHVSCLFHQGPQRYGFPGINSIARRRFNKS